uniref:Replicase polyprotein 1ab n=1 Tax=Anthurium amnicola TaxID=1678845 RepID=A0A1D1XSE0_9ARAE
MSSSSSSQQNASVINNCEWTINVSNCFGQEYFQVVYGVTTYLSLFIFLCSIWLLSWRLYSKPDIRLFKMKDFLTLEGYLFIQIFWGAARVFICIMLIYNLFPGKWIVREVSLEISWFLGLVSVVTYLAGVLRIIPRMYFYRQNPHYKHSLHLPNLRGVSGVYISFILVSGIIRITCAVFSGYFRQYPTNNSDRIIKIVETIYYCTCSISAFVVAIGFIVYGNKLVKIASEGLHLLEGVSGYPSKSSRSKYSMGTELEVKHKKLQRSVRKMRIINTAFILSFVALSITLGVYAFMSDQIINNIDVSKILASTSNWMPMILNIFVMGGIAYGEMRVPDKSEPKLEDIIIPTLSNSIPDASQSPAMEQISSDMDSFYHSRNNSTDSDAPLLRWPAPVVTVSTRRGSAQLDSPISIASSSTSPPYNVTQFFPTPNNEDASTS